MTTQPWPFGMPPYSKSCGTCGWQYLAMTVDAGVPVHECKKKPEPANFWDRSQWIVAGPYAPLRKRSDG